MSAAKPVRDRVQRLVKIDAGLIDEDPRNARSHPSAQRTALQEAFDKIGVWDAVIVRRVGKRYVLLDGHLRRDMLAGQKVPALIVDLTEREAAEVLATHDAVGGLAEFDEGKLRALVKEFESGPATRAMLAELVTEPLDFTGFENPDDRPPGESPGEKSTEGEDEAPVVPTDALVEKWSPALGQLWVVPSLSLPGREHRLLCGDCRLPENVARLHEGAKSKLSVHDPPYGVRAVRRATADKGRTAGLSRVTDPAFKRFETANKAQAKTVYAPIEGDEKPFDPAHIVDSAEIVVAWGANNYASKLPDSAEWVVWYKQPGMKETDQGAAEVAWVTPPTGRRGHLRGIEHLWSGVLRATEVTEKRLHPTQKPEAVQGQIVEWYSEPGDLVADWYMGAGAVGLACERLGRVFHGMDIAPCYLAATLERFERRGLKPRLEG